MSKFFVYGFRKKLEQKNEKIKNLEKEVIGLKGEIESMRMNEENGDDDDDLKSLDF